MNPNTRKRLIENYRNTLLDDVLPFWLNHAIDAEYGGMINSVDRTGALVDTDKGVWHQGRSAWLMGEPDTNVEPRPGRVQLCLEPVAFLENE